MCYTTTDYAETRIYPAYGLTDFKCDEFSVNGGMITLYFLISNSDTDVLYTKAYDKWSKWNAVSSTTAWSPTDNTMFAGPFNDTKGTNIGSRLLNVFYRPIVVSGTFHGSNNKIDLGSN